MTPTPRLKMTAACSKWRIVGPWNDLPEELRRVDKISQFKRQLRTETARAETGGGGEETDCEERRGGEKVRLLTKMGPRS